MPISSMLSTMSCRSTQQPSWVERAQHVLVNHRYYLDTRPAHISQNMTTIWLAKTLKVPVLIVAPNSSVRAWLSALNYYNVYCIDFLSYSELQGSDETAFSRLSNWEHAIKEGVLVIFDIPFQARTDHRKIEAEIMDLVCSNKKSYAVFHLHQSMVTSDYHRLNEIFDIVPSLDQVLSE